MSKSESKTERTERTEYALTKYEKARILGVRALQLSNGAQPMVKIDGITDVMDIAKKELCEYKLPFIIRRKFPDGSYIDVKLSDMIVS
jgi:DNA-directed RNA polymerase I, II, and III subunit RPABC2